MIKTIIWDWNGTLLNDIDICINSINILLEHRNIENLTKEIYKEIFTFPVKDYYSKAGFDFTKEDFDIPATEFINIYNRRIIDADLFQGVTSVLEHFKNRNYQQLIISAMEQDSLVKSIFDKGIGNYFTHISGINNHYAVSKVENAKNLIKKVNINPQQVCMIGDTIHDYEVAGEIGCNCIIVANGHQSYKRLKPLNCTVVNKLTDVIKCF
ncbi:MAG: HAD family hydrolase [Bacteroidales bacterium]|nr:HAD family hydrolase [Bacteroidales bacterium]